MFKQVKSAVFWYYLYKFRRKVLIISFLLFLAIFANAIYSDVVEYLTLKEKLEYLELALILKWLIIISSLISSIYLVLSIFKGNKEEKTTKKKIDKKENNDIIESSTKLKKSKLTKREEEFLKKDLKSKADLLVER